MDKSKTKITETALGGALTKFLSHLERQIIEIILFPLLGVSRLLLRVTEGLVVAMETLMDRWAALGG